MNNPTRIEVLDGWRGAAILLVLIGHFTFSEWIREERLGVDTFFVLSGMLMAKILFVDRMGLKDFYIRRLSRIMPVLCVFLCVAWALSLALKYEFSSVEIVSSLFFVRTYFPAQPEYFTSPIPTGHLWSLSVEEHSYVIMSLISLVLIVRKNIAYLLLSIYLFSVVINCVNLFNLSPQQFTYSLIRTESAIGFIAFSAGYFLLKRERDIRLPSYTSLVCIAAATICYTANVPNWLTVIASPILLGVAINHLTQSNQFLQTILKNPIMRYMGIFSYSIYLWQQIFYKLYYALPYGQVTGFLASIITGVASFYILENPARNYINNRWSKNPSYRTQSISGTLSPVETTQSSLQESESQQHFKTQQDLETVSDKSGSAE